MPMIIFVEPDGSRHAIKAEVGISVMEAARSHGMPGIAAECSGACACATCHVYVAQEWWNVTGEPGDDEREILQFADDVDEQSRLSCQIILHPDMDGLVITLPAAS